MSETQTNVSEKSNPDPVREIRRGADCKKTKVHVRDTDQCFRKKGGEGREEKGANANGSRKEETRKLPVPRA